MEITPAPGRFCWVELATTDEEAGTRYYGRLFGWNSVRAANASEMPYTMFQAGEQNVAGMFTLCEDQRAQGVPAHWLPYIQVADLAAAVGRAKDLGGQVAGPEAYDVEHVARVAYIQDPTGAYFALWQPNPVQGTGLSNAPGRVCWIELATPAAESAKVFYSNLFGWSAETSDMGGVPYTIFSEGGEMMAGMMPLQQDMEGVPPHWLSYFSVTDIEAAVTATEADGGKTLAPVAPIPGMGRYAVLADPAGAVFGVLQYDEVAMPQ